MSEIDFVSISGETACENGCCLQDIITIEKMQDHEKFIKLTIIKNDLDTFCNHNNDNKIISTLIISEEEKPKFIEFLDKAIYYLKNN